MSDLAGRIDADAIAALRVSQWAGAPRLNALMAEILAVATTGLTEPLARLEASRRPPGADGYWLDLIGERLGLIRPNVLDTSFQRFGFDAAGVGFGQGPFDTVIESLVARVAVGDPYYRCLLAIRGRALLAGGTVPGLEAMLRVEFPDVLVEDHADGTITIRNVANDPRQNLATIAEAMIRAAAPAGVTVRVPA